MTKSRTDLFTALLSTNGLVLAWYEYDPYGNMLAQSGPLADANVYRFSSKAWHANSGLYYYGYRFYAPELQRWLNRDPIEEEGGINLYGFAENDAIGEFDDDGNSYHHAEPGNSTGNPVSLFGSGLL